MDTKPITELLYKWKSGDEAAMERLADAVYPELKKIAAALLVRENGIVTLQPSDLVHEAWIRLVAGGVPILEHRTHLYGIVTRLIRQILIDRARARTRKKRTGGARVELSTGDEFSMQQSTALLRFDDLLRDLSRLDPQKAQIVELKYFGGMTAEDSAEFLNIPVHRVNRQMKLATAWMRSQLGVTPDPQQASKAQDPANNEIEFAE